MNRVTLLICGFPGVGKSTLFEEGLEDLIVLDSDSSTFSKDNFPSNYVEHIKSKIDKVDVIFVSTHADLLDSLLVEELSFIVVYPSMERKEEFLANYLSRGSSKEFIQKLEENWETWINSIKKLPGVKLEMTSGFLKDYLSVESVRLLQNLILTFNPNWLDTYSKSSSEVYNITDKENGK